MDKEDFLYSGRDPDAMSGELRRRYHYINVAMVFVAVAALPYVPLYLSFGLVYAPWFIGAAIVLLLCTIVALRRGLSTMVAAHICVAAIWGAVVSSGTEVGGLRSAGKGWFLVIPSVALLLAGAKAGLIWGAVCVATLIVYYVAHRYDVLLPGLQGQDHLSGNLAGTLGAMAALAGVITTLFMEAKHQRARTRATLSELQTENENRRLAEEEARRALAARSRFLAIMSHEVRTPLHGVSGVNQLLEQTELTQHQRELVTSSIGATTSLQRVLDDVLDFSKLATRGLEVELEPIQPADVVQDVVALFQPKAHAKRLTLVGDVSAYAGETVMSDPGRLRQVLLNLVSNAIKFTHEGGVTLTLSGSAGALSFAVADTGVGIAGEHLARLFEPFEQASADTNRRFGGSGLGLAISRELAMLLGGTLTVSTTVGDGSCFTFVLDAEVVGAGDALSNAPASEASAGRSLRVLVVDDVPLNRRVAELMLEKDGHVVMLACDGDEAVAALREMDFDIVLMDVVMPIKDGMTATREIRALSDRGAAVPIVAVTANASTADRQSYLDCGMDGFLAKPLKFDTIRRELARLSNGRPQPG